MGTSRQSSMFKSDAPNVLPIAANIFGDGLQHCPGSMRMFVKMSNAHFSQPLEQTRPPIITPNWSNVNMFYLFRSMCGDENSRVHKSRAACTYDDRRMYNSHAPDVQSEIASCTNGAGEMYRQEPSAVQMLPANRPGSNRLPMKITIRHFFERNPSTWMPPRPPKLPL